MRFTPFAPAADRRTPWFEQSNVHTLLQDEQAALLPWLAAQVGVRGVYCRADGSLPATLAGNMLQHVTHLHRAQGRLAGAFVGDDARLPLLSDSLQLVYAQHVLETSPAPLALLDEFARCLQPEGVLVLVGLARFSPWRLRWRGRGLRPLPRDEILAGCERVGLSIERVLAIGPHWPSWRGGVAADDEAARGSGSGWRPLRPSWALLARKRRAGMTAVGRTAQVRFQPRAWPT